MQFKNRQLVAGLFLTLSASACGSNPLSPSTFSRSAAVDEATIDDGIVPPERYYSALKSEQLTQQRAAQVLWINFDGAYVQRGYGRGQTFILCKDAAWIPAAGFSAKERAAVLEKVKGNYGDAGVKLILTTTKPASGDYTTMHVGGTYQTLGCSGSGVLGIAPLDRGNMNPNDVAFAFAGQHHSADIMGDTVAHEAAHSFGLEHVREENDVMYYRSTREVGAFRNSTTLNGRNQNEPVLLRRDVGAIGSSLE